MRGTAIGSYCLLEKLGEGGTGTVWIAEHTLLGRRAAIKLLHPTYSTHEVMVQRFFNEAKAVAAIADPGIVQVFDFGVHTDGSPYLVMELLDGEAVDARLRRLGRLTPWDAIRLTRQAAMSLSAAHGKGVIHRDVKPENLFVARDPAMPGGERVKVLDFGIAKLSQGEGKHKTRTGAVLGTPAYMSPEQCRALGNIDHRTDVYSLGAVLFCLVTGRPPFEGEGAGDAIISHVRDLPPVPSSLAPDLPAGLDGVILRCLEKDPARRYQAMVELAVALDRIDAGPRERAPTGGFDGRHPTLGGPVQAAASSIVTTVSDALGEVAPGWRAMRWRWVGLAASVVVGLVVAIAIASGGSEGPGERPPAAGEPAGSAEPTAPAAAAPAAPPEAEPRPAAAPIPPEPVAAPSVAAPAAPPDAAIAVDAEVVAAPARPRAAPAGTRAVPAPVPAPRPKPAPKTRDNRRDKEGATRHGTDTKASPGRSGLVDHGD